MLVHGRSRMRQRNAFRPGDVIRPRRRLPVEIGNTDAEGRLILCDALAYAAEQKPGLIVDFATLTGAARVALGPELPVMFSNSEALAAKLLAAGAALDDPMWRLPLWRDYRRFFDSDVADFNNAGRGGFAGRSSRHSSRLLRTRTLPGRLRWFSWNDAAAGPARGRRAQACARSCGDRR